MARARRVHLPGGYYYLRLHGSSGCAPFADDRDRSGFLRCLYQAAARYHVSILSGCLRGDQVHLVVRISRQPLSYLVQSLMHRYHGRLARRHGSRPRPGVFQSRYHACLLEPAQWLLPAVRHVARGAQLAPGFEIARHNPWTMHSGCCGFGWPLSAPIPETEVAPRVPYSVCRYGICHDVPPDEQEAYAARWLPRLRVLASPRFRRHLERHAAPPARGPDLDQVVAHVCAAYGLSAAELGETRRWRRPAEARAMVAWLARDSGAATLINVARHFDRSLATISLGLRRLEQQPDRVARAQQLRATLAPGQPAAVEARPGWLLPPACPQMQPAEPVRHI